MALPPIHIEKHFNYRWTGDQPCPAFMTELARLCATSKNDKELDKVGIFVWQDVTGWAFTRYMLEREYDQPHVTPLRAKRLGILLNTLPLWPVDPTPTGWSQDGFPKELF